MATTELKIEGMTCLNCVSHTQKALEAVPGVRSVQVDLAAGTATVQHENAEERKMVAAVVSAGYQARPA